MDYIEIILAKIEKKNKLRSQINLKAYNLELLYEKKIHLALNNIQISSLEDSYNNILKSISMTSFRLIANNAYTLYFVTIKNISPKDANLKINNDVFVKIILKLKKNLILEKSDYFISSIETSTLDEKQKINHCHILCSYNFTDKSKILTAVEKKDKFIKLITSDLNKLYKNFREHIFEKDDKDFNGNFDVSSSVLFLHKKGGYKIEAVTSYIWKDINRVEKPLLINDFRDKFYIKWWNSSCDSYINLQKNCLDFLTNVFEYRNSSKIKLSELTVSYLETLAHKIYGLDDLNSELKCFSEDTNINLEGLNKNIETLKINFEDNIKTAELFRINNL